MSILEDEETPYLVTNCTFDNRDYLIKMYVRSNILKLSIIDNTTSEKWVCKYNSMYIEELTRRTGNYKKFSIFVAMLNSGILRTNSCVRIELMSHSDLEALSERPRYREIPEEVSEGQDTRKYLILIYTVEFDKIHYPLPLEYCGMPDPRILQKRINYLEKEKHRLEEEVAQSVCGRCTSQLPQLQDKVAKLIEEKKCLQDEVKCLAAQLGSRYKNKTIPQTSAMSQQEKYQMQGNINRLEQENQELRKTLHVMNKKLHQPIGRAFQQVQRPKTQLKKCQKCATAQCVKDMQKIPNVSPKIFTPNLTPTMNKNVRNNLKQSLGCSSSRSSVSSSKRSIGRRKVRRRSDLESTSSGGESGAERKVSTRRSRSGGRSSQLNASPPPTVSKMEIGKNIRSQNYKQASPESITALQTNNVITPEELRSQINELIKVVESWSTNLYNYFPGSN